MNSWFYFSGFSCRQGHARASVAVCHRAFIIRHAHSLNVAVAIWSEYHVDMSSLPFSLLDCVHLSVVLCPPALEAERVFAVLSFLMAVSTGALCLVFALCWTSETVLSYSNTRSLLMAGQTLYPTTLMLLTMGSTGNTSKYAKHSIAWAMFFVFHFVNTETVVDLGVLK